MLGVEIVFDNREIICLERVASFCMIMLGPVAAKEEAREATALEMFGELRKNTGSPPPDRLFCFNTSAPYLENQRNL